MAKQWARYRTDPDKYNYRAGQTVNILFNVAESGCGSRARHHFEHGDRVAVQLHPVPAEPGVPRRLPRRRRPVLQLREPELLLPLPVLLRVHRRRQTRHHPRRHPGRRHRQHRRTPRRGRDHRHRHRTHRAGRDRDPGRVVLARHPVRVGRRQQPGPHPRYQGRLLAAVPGVPGLDDHRVRLLRPHPLRVGAGRGRPPARLLRPGQPRPPTPLHPGPAGGPAVLGRHRRSTTSPCISAPSTAGTTWSSHRRAATT